jgi:multiple sugar transport system substrate-binding protein
MTRFRPLLIALAGALALNAATAQTITFWHTYNTASAEEATLVDVVIPAFEAANPGTTVEAVGYPYGEFRQALLTGFAGGVVPDLVRMDIIWVPEFAELGALERLDGYPGFDELAAAVFPGPLSTNFWRDGYYGLPLTTNTQVFVYDADALAAAGATPPATFEAFAEFVRTAGNPEEDVWAYALPGPWAWHFLPWIWSNGGAVTDEAITVASGYLNSAETVEAVQMLADLYQEGRLAPTIAQSGIGTWEGLGGGNYISSQDGPWAHPAITSQYPDLTLEHALMPAGKGGSASVVGGEDLVMFADSRQKDVAWAFAQHMLSLETQMTMAPTGQLPVLNAALEEPYIVEHPFYGVYLEQLQTARARTPHPAWSRIEDVIQLAFQRVVAGEQTAQEAFDAAATEVDALLR